MIAIWVGGPRDGEEVQLPDETKFVVLAFMPDTQINWKEEAKGKIPQARPRGERMCPIFPHRDRQGKLSYHIRYYEGKVMPNED